MRRPFSTVQWESFSFAFLTAASYSSLDILARLLIATSPCQLVKSLPLNRAVKPGGGALSRLPPALTEVAPRKSTTLRPVRVNHRRIVGSFHCRDDCESGYGCYPAKRRRELQA